MSEIERKKLGEAIPMTATKETATKETATKETDSSLASASTRDETASRSPLPANPPTHAQTASAKVYFLVYPPTLTA